MDNHQTPVFINLLAIAKYDQMPEYPIQFMTTGKLFYKDSGEAQLQYVESQQDEVTGEITRPDITLQFSGSKVTMQRNGSFSNTMVFSSGKRFEGIYRTPYGEMDMAVFTKEAACRIGNHEGSVHLKYQLQIQGSYASTNELHLEYRAEPADKGAKEG